MVEMTKDELKQIVRDANKDLLLETSYNRVRSHIQGGEAFVMIRSDRHEQTPAENKRRFKQLKQEYKIAGFSFTEIKGGYKETTEYVKDPDSGEEVETRLEEPRTVTENTLLITTHFRPDVERAAEDSADQLFDFTVKAAQKYNQEAFIFGEEAETRRGLNFKDIRAYNKRGEKIQDSWAGPWTSIKVVEDDEDFWSRVKGKHFQLAEKKKTSQPRSWFEAMKKSKSGYEW